MMDVGYTEVIFSPVRIKCNLPFEGAATRIRGRILVALKNVQ